MSGVETLKLAEAAFAAKDFAAALPLCERALSEGLDVGGYESERGEYCPHPETAQCELLWGMSLHEIGQSDAAIPHLDRAVSFDIENCRTWANRGHVRRERGELELALSDLSRSLKQQPRDAFALFRRAQCYAALSQAANAEHDLEAILTTNPFDEASFALWQSLREQRGERTGRGALPRPQDYFGLLQRALVLSTRGELELAIVDYDAAFALAPELIVRAYRGQTHHQLGNLELALADLEAYLASEPNNEPTRSALEDVRAKLAARQ
ncbi:MAG: tetratricopeptide repeat protein [Polyangiaceae bacterium]